ncbi:hypothetical protein XENOCAPTIV_031005, partial [Xenoophorus captivus]
MNSLEQAEDLKAFERRLTEYVSCLQPATGRWRMILIVVSVCTATGAWNWLIDPDTQKVTFFSSLWNHPFFTISCITLIALFFAGIHKRVVAPSIVPAQIFESLHVPAFLEWCSRARPSPVSSRGTLLDGWAPCCWTAAWPSERQLLGRSGFDSAAVPMKDQSNPVEDVANEAVNLLWNL